MGVVTPLILAAALASLACPRTAAPSYVPVTPPSACVVDVPITIDNRSHMTASELDAIVETAGRLWRPYGVTLAVERKDGVAIIVSDGSSDDRTHQRLIPFRDLQCPSAAAWG